MLYTNYYFLRIHVITAGEMPDKLDFFRTGLSSHALIEQYGHSYKFLDVNYLNDHEFDSFSGCLVKYSKEYGEEVVNESLSELSETNISNKVIGKVRFIVIPKESLLIFHEDGNIINRSIFQNKFQELFEENFGNFFVEIRTQSITDEYSFLEEVKKFQSIKNITISLVPSNPRFSDRWRSIDERLRSIKATNYKEIIENKAAGSIEIDKETESKVYMSEDGYGETTATGVDENGSNRTISTKAKNKIKRKAVPKDLVEPPRILGYLSETIDSILKRTRK